MKLLPSAHSGPRLGVIAILGVLLARPTAAQSTTPTFVQAATFSTGSRVSTVTVTLTRPVAQGDLLVGWVSEYNDPAQVQVSDNVNGAWTRGPGSLPFMDDTGDIALYYRENSQAAPGGLTITVSVSSSAPAYLQGTVADYSGIALAGALDQVASARGIGTTVDTGATAAVDAGELVFAALITGDDPRSVTPGSSAGVPYTPRAQNSNGSAFAEDITSSAAGAQQGTATFGAAANWLAVCAVFHASPATAPQPPSTPARRALHVVRPHPDRGGCGWRRAARVVRPGRRVGPGAGLGQRQRPLDALRLGDVGGSGRHRALLPAAFRSRAIGRRDHGVGVRSRLPAGGGRGLPTRGSARPSGGIARYGNLRHRGSDRPGTCRRAGRRRRPHRRPTRLRGRRKQPAGAVPHRRAERQRLLRPRGHPVQRRRPAGGEPDLGLGLQLGHGAGYVPVHSRVDDDEHHDAADHHIDVHHHDHDPRDDDEHHDDAAADDHHPDVHHHDHDPHDDDGHSTTHHDHRTADNDDANHDDAAGDQHHLEVHDDHDAGADNDHDHHAADCVRRAVSPVPRKLSARADVHGQRPPGDVRLSLRGALGGEASSPP